MSWRDPKFRYLGAATHADPTAFARRQKARQRERQEEERQREQERTEKVRPITVRRRPSCASSGS